jgi:hypothetical protein
MKYHSVRNAGCLAVWVAEADDEDGGVYTAIFIGKNARQRAEEYAAWKNGSLDPEGHGPEGHGKVPEQPKAA